MKGRWAKCIDPALSLSAQTKIHTSSELHTTHYELHTPKTHLQKVPLLQVAADRGDDLGARAEGAAGLIAHDQVEVALPVALLNVRQPVPLVGEREERLGQDLGGGTGPVLVVCW